MIHGEIDSGCYLSSVSGSLKKCSSSDIDCVVDGVLAGHKRQDGCVRRSSRKLSWKKVVFALFAAILLIAAVPYVLPPLYGDFGGDISVELYPSDGVHLNDTLYINLTIPTSYNITSVSADMASIETIELLFVYDDSIEQFWQGVWFVHSLVPGEYIIDVFAVDDVGVSYGVGLGLSVLPDLLPPFVNGSVNDTQPPETNDSQQPDVNDTVPPDINSTVPPKSDSGNFSDNETHQYAGLDLTLNYEKIVYAVNETVEISGIITLMIY